MSDNHHVSSNGDTGKMSLLDKIIRFCLDNKLVALLLTLAIVVAGVRVAPFDWDVPWLPRNPVPVDAIPDIGENQQIVFTEWMGRSPQDVEDQITYPLTVSLLGIPDVRTVRSYSMFGFSTIYIIFKDNVDFYWSRSRVLEKLNSLPAGTMPEGVQPALGPDATALGQIFWYTLEGRDEDGHPTGGWDLNELRSIQDWQVRYSLLSADGISEVASVGGFVQEYQIDVDPDAMRAHRVTLDEVFMAVKMSNVDVGARTIEVNKVEYVIRGLGLIKGIEDIENFPEYEVEADAFMGITLHRIRMHRQRILDMGEILPLVTARGPLCTAGFVRGTTEFMIDLVEQPEWAHKLIDRCTRLIIDWLKAQHAAMGDSVEGLFLLDDIVGFINEEHYREFAHPYLRRICDAFPADWVKIYHNDADITACLDHLPDCGFNVLNWGKQTDIAEVKQRVGDRMCLMGNVNPLEIGVQGTREEVHAATLEVLEKSGGEGIILSVGGGTSPGTPRENILAMLEALEEFNTKERAL